MLMGISKAVCMHVSLLFPLLTPLLDLTTKVISDSELAELTTQRALASTWTSLAPSLPSSHIHVLPSLEHTVQTLERIHSNSGISLHVLVTGSLHLIGGIVEVAGLSDVAL